MKRTKSKKPNVIPLSTKGPFTVVPGTPPQLKPQPERPDMQAVYAHRDKLEGVMLKYLKGLWQVPDGNLLTFMRKQNADLVKFLLDEEYLLAYIAGEHNK